MATEEMKTNPNLDALFTQLAEPFDPSEIKWRVTHTNRDGNRGAVIAYADPRAYTDRLNQLFTPTGWTRSYQVSTVSSVTRMKRDKLIQTGKVLVTCTLTITGLGCHSGSGEEWADEQNAMTTALAKFFTPRDMYTGTLLSAAEALHSGTTTVNNWCHNIVTHEHAVERCDQCGFANHGLPCESR